MKKILIILFFVMQSLFLSKLNSAIIYGHPSQALQAVKYSSDSSNLPSPDNTVVTISPANNVIIQPVLKVLSEDIGKKAEILMYVVINDEGYLLPSYYADLKSELTFKNIPNEVDLSNYSNLTAVIYFGYEIESENKIGYNVYTLKVSSDSDNNTSSFSINLTSNSNESIVKPLQGVISGPTPPCNSKAPDLTTRLQDIGITGIRNNAYYDETLDIEGIFKCPDNSTHPSWNCDADNDSNYYWEKSDNLVTEILNNGFELFLRIGGSESTCLYSYDFHGPQNKTQENNWITVGKKIIERYLHWGGRDKAFEYVDIITEWPNKYFFDRTAGDFMKFWAKAFKEFKSAYSDLKVGGPGFLVPTQDVMNGKVKDNLAVQFLEYMYKNDVKPDWIGWHLWSNNPEDYSLAAKQFRDLLDGKGDFASVSWAGTDYFKNTELICDAYGVATTKTQNGEMVDLPSTMQYKLQNKKEGAAVIAGTWIALQYSNTQRAFYYRAGDPLSDPDAGPGEDNMGWSGLFYGDPNGTYKPKAYAFRLFSLIYKNFSNLMDVDLPVESSDGEKLWVLGAKKEDNSSYAVLVTNLNDDTMTYNLNIDGNRILKQNYYVSIYQVDDTNNGRIAQAWNGNSFSIPAYTVQLIIIVPKNISSNDKYNFKVESDESSGSVNLGFNFSTTKTASLEVYDLSGNKLKTLINQKSLNGTQKIEWDGKCDNGTVMQYGMFLFKLNIADGETISKIGFLPIQSRLAYFQTGLNFIRYYFGDENYFQPETINKDFVSLNVPANRHLMKADLTWDSIEPTNDDWHFEKADEVIMNAPYEPIVTLFKFQYASPTPPWETDPDKFQKTLGEDAKDYLIHVLKRYGPYVKYWEIGNEIDLHWHEFDLQDTENRAKNAIACYPKDGFSPQEQGIFLSQVANFIKKYDSDAVIILAGLTGLGNYSIRTWLEGVIEGSGSSDWFDVISYHYYGDWRAFKSQRQNFSQVLNDLGISDKHVWCTETGSTSSSTLTVRTNYPNSEDTQAADVFRRLILSWAYGDEVAIWHTYISSPDNVSNVWRAYGIKDEYGNAKKSYYSFKLLTSELIPFKSISSLSSCDSGQYCFKIITKNDEIKYVVWGEGNFTVPDGVTQKVSVVPDNDGTFSWEAVNENEIISLSATPILLK